MDKLTIEEYEEIGRGWAKDDDDTRAELYQQLADTLRENERLRTALKNIVDNYPIAYGGSQFSMARGAGASHNEKGERYIDLQRNSYDAAVAALKSSKTL